MGHVTDDRDEIDDFRGILENVREWNGFWTWRDKSIAERGAATQILSGGGLHVSDLVARPAGLDPPDCEGVVDGQWSGVEVTELVHEKTLRRSIKALKERAKGGDPDSPEAYFRWTRADLLKALQALIKVKDGASLKGGPYERYILVIHSDEYLLHATQVEQFLSGATFSASGLITDVFLGLSYEPELQRCPVFQLALTGHADRPIR